MSFVTTFSVNGADLKESDNLAAFELLVPNQTKTSDILVYGDVHVADTNEWPASRYFEIGLSKLRCTATFVGPRIFVTAAHCLDYLSEDTIFEVDGKKYLFGCKSHNSADIAACVLDKKYDQGISWKKKFRFESLNHYTGNELASGDLLNKKVVLLGFGCREVGGCNLNEEDCAHGELYYGYATIDRIKLPNLISRNSTVTTCNGDSGGGSFLEIAKYLRIMVGVNSHSDVLADSKLVAIHSSEVQTFFNTIISNLKVNVCGINLDGNRCVQY